MEEWQPNLHSKGVRRAGLERAGLERAGSGSGLERGRLELEPRYILCELVVFLMLDTRFLLTLNEAS